MKKNHILLMIALGAVATFASCGKDNEAKKKDSIIGTWDITDASGVEWEWDDSEGAGEIVNTVDPDNEFIGELIVVTSTGITVGEFGPMTYTFTDNVLTLNLGEGETLVFDVTFNTQGVSNTWAERAPTAMSQYEYNEEGENYLFYQKTWKLEPH